MQELERADKLLRAASLKCAVVQKGIDRGDMRDARAVRSMLLDLDSAISCAVDAIQVCEKYKKYIKKQKIF